MVHKITVRKDQSGSTTIADSMTNNINQAHVDAIRMADRVVNDMETIWNQNKPRKHQRRQAAWLANANFVTFLGDASLTRNQIWATRRRINNILRRLNNGPNYIVIQHQTGNRSFGCKADSNANAYAHMWGQGKRIFLCPAWFTRTQIQRPAIIIHETVHKLGFFGKRHHRATNEGTAVALAIAHPRRARKSPENYEHLYELFF